MNTGEALFPLRPLEWWQLPQVWGGLFVILCFVSALGWLIYKKRGQEKVKHIDSSLQALRSLSDLLKGDLSQNAYQIMVVLEIMQQLRLYIADTYQLALSALTDKELFHHMNGLTLEKRPSAQLLQIFEEAYYLSYDIKFGHLMTPAQGKVESLCNRAIEAVNADMKIRIEQSLMLAQDEHDSKDCSNGS